MKFSLGELFHLKETLKIKFSHGLAPHNCDGEREGL
jgi:hypothetical protein